MFINGTFVDILEFKLTVERLTLFVSQLKAAQTEQEELIKAMLSLAPDEINERIKRVMELTEEISRYTKAINKTRELLHSRFSFVRDAFNL